MSEPFAEPEPDGLGTAAPPPVASVPPEPVWVQPSFEPAPAATAAVPVGEPSSPMDAPPAFQPPPPDELTHPPAPARPVGPLWRRGLARIIDVVVATALGVSGFLLYLVTMFPGSNWMTADHVSFSYSGGDVGPILAPFVIAGLLNEVALVGLFGASLGMLLTGLRLVDARTMQPVGITQALVRWGLPAFGLVLCLVPGVFVWVSPLWGGPTRQGLHDRLAKTLVVTSGQPVTR